MGALFSATYRADNERPAVVIEAVREGERWSISARSGDARIEVQTWSPDPTPTIWRLIGEALDSKAEAEPSPYDMNRKLAKPATKPSPLRRRGKVSPGDLPQWTPPET